MILSRHSITFCFFGAFVVISCDIRTWFKGCWQWFASDTPCFRTEQWPVRLPGVQLELAARHGGTAWLVRYGLPTGSTRRAVLWGLDHEICYLHRFIGSQVPWSFHTWVGKWSGQPTRQRRIKVRLAFKMKLHKAAEISMRLADSNMLIVLDANVRCRQLQVQHDSQDCLSMP